MKDLKELANDARLLCYEIEKLPASEQQTKASVMASELLQNIVNTFFQLDDATCCKKIGKKRAGSLLDGREWKEYPKLKGGVDGQLVKNQREKMST